MIQIPLLPILAYILVFMRVLFFVAFLPVFGELFVPVRVRVLLAAAIALVFAPVAAVDVRVFPESLAGMMALMLPEVALGMAFGLIGRLAFAAVQFGGQVIGEQIGFGMANLVDPSQMREVPIVAEMLYVVSLLVFFSSNAHHAFFAALARSFELAPPGFVRWSSDLTLFLSVKTGQMFVIGVQMSLPIVAAIFASNVAMGMVAKGVPQLNVFIESFPVRIILGLILLTLAAGFLVRIMTQGFDTLSRDLGEILRMMGV
ncbi:flagellar biosynthetic protein FliR [Candidatus Sumerlaeota bacterium]|nr:flagellar biosynthetic protein FliR [Candidatus Sumerlaeota bacterium]